MKTLYLTFKHPSTYLVAGPTGCGKTQWVAKLLKHRMIEKPPERIVWVYAGWQPLYTSLQSDVPELEFVKGIKSNLYESFDPKTRNLLVLDDQMSEAGNSTQLTQLFTKGSHHRNLSIVYIVQNVFDKGRSMRTVSLNSQYLVIFKNPRDQSQLSILANQIFPRASKQLNEAFQAATQVPYGYLLLDLRPETPDSLRVRTRVFPYDGMVVYPIETKENELLEIDCLSDSDSH